MSLGEVRGLIVGYAVTDLVLIALAFGVLWLMRRVVLSRLDPRPATLHQPLWRQAVQGVAYALAAIALSVLPVWIGGGYSAGPTWQAFAPENVLSLPGATLIWLFFCVQSLAEELAFRAIGMVLLAVLLFWLADWLFTPIATDKHQGFIHRLWFLSGTTANIIVAVAFAWVHHDNPNLTTLALINIALAGLVLGQLFWMQGTPLGAWIMHWLWNAGLATLGLPVSGYTLMPPMLGLGPSGARAGVFSGGAFGPEGSIVCTVALLLVWCSMIHRSVRGLRSGDGGEQAPHTGDVRRG